MKKSKFRKFMMLAVSQTMLLLAGGTCLPDNVFADAAGQIINGVIIAGFNMVTAGSGLQV